MVVVSFQNSLNAGNVDLYKSLFSGVTNPNGCPARGSFYIQEKWTDFTLVYGLYKQGHEIGIHSLNGSTPKDWKGMYKNVLETLTNNKVNRSGIHGTRAPRLSVGGNGQFSGLVENNLLYDSSCINRQHSTPSSYLWPFTLDYKPFPSCDIGKMPSKTFAGMWEFMLADLWKDGAPCATPSACSNVRTRADSFKLFLDAFSAHYNNKRQPFMMVVDPAFSQNQTLLNGAIDFIHHIRGTFQDAWIVTAYQALEWIKNPTPIAKLSTFGPWKC